ncbi:Kelch repeat-containing protein [Agarilytica rhodophyticola]|uniref:Kelch repeat-containing protein n=1 Tax=Agarilytica rhodophyticola TaxID=1737490 RepID=UPI000B342BAE|nr:kelch repeat-containing protein [Agarilytica rhodophyticola]
MNTNKFLLRIILNCTFVIHNGVFAETWGKAKELPEAIQELYTDTHDDMIYIGGGIPKDDANFTNSFRRYNVEENVWEELSPMPERRHHVTTSAMDDYIYAIGGFTGAFPYWQAQDSIYIYSLQNGKWIEGVNLPSPRGEHISVEINGKIYVIGGRVRSSADAKHFTEHHDTKLNEIFDPKTKRWMQGAPAPTARNSAAAAAIDSKIYVVGGRQNQTDKNGEMPIANLPNLEIYDTKTNKWESESVMPLAQGGLAATSANGKLYVFGGEKWYPNQKVFANAWVYNPLTDRWQALPDMPTPRHGLAAAVLNNTIHVFGGATVNGLGAVGTHEILKLNSDK